MLRKIVALPKYEKQVERLLSESERAAMEASIAKDPLAYPLIRGTGGFRKARWSRGTSGKSGGVRAIFYYFVSGDTVFLTLLYAKNELENLTHAQENELKRLAQAIESHR
jgi:mRNA-degrading endonuclease RelE of RelBE toxin-antitoxin system